MHDKIFSRLTSKSIVLKQPSESNYFRETPNLGDLYAISLRALYLII